MAFLVGDPLDRWISPCLSEYSGSAIQLGGFSLFYEVTQQYLTKFCYRRLLVRKAEKVHITWNQHATYSR